LRIVPFFIPKRLERLNATRMSVAGEGLTEPIHNLRITQMQTSLAGGVKTKILSTVVDGFFVLYDTFFINSLNGFS